MWIGSVYGWFSIVQKEGQYYVRARTISDLKILKEVTGLCSKILMFAGTDYIARIIITKDELDIVKNALFDSINYSNFKDKIKNTSNQKEKLKFYHNVWADMNDYQLDKHKK